MTNKPEQLEAEDDADGRASDSESDEWLKGIAHVPSQPPPRDRTGERIGRYDLKGRLGKGGMGVVYDAFDVRLQRNVALKLLSDDVIDDVERRRRFLREAKLTAKLNHPNIVALYEVGEIDGLIFLAMERVIGSTLRERLDEAKGGLPVSEAVRITREIALGVAEAHRHGVIHRDIKPENIMICRDGKVKLLDFGLAKALERVQPSVAYQSTEISAVHGRVVGTLRYMSPEQVRGTGVDERSDVFAIGVVLYEMLSGTRPFRGATNTDVMASILRDLPVPISHVPPALWRIVAGCLSKNPEERYPNAAELAEALDSRRWASPFRQRLARYWLPLLFLPLLVFAISKVVIVDRKIVPPPKSSSSSAPEAPPKPPSNEPVRIIDLPLPKSTEKMAVEHYLEALKHFREANWGAAEEELRKSQEIDPNLAETHLRLALTQMSYGAVRESGRSEFNRADALKTAMTQRDRDLLEAFRPMFEKDVADVAKTIEKVEELSQKYSNDAEIFLYLASFLRYSSPERRLVAAKRAVELDKDYADALQMLGATLFELDPDEAISALDRCMRSVHVASGSDCLGERARLKSLQHRCREAEEDANSAMSGANPSEWIIAFHAPLLYSLDKPRNEVLGALQHLWDRPHSSATVFDKTYQRGILAAAYGDFDRAKTEALNGRTTAITEKNRTEVERFTMLLVEIELESGSLVEAAQLAGDFLGDRNASAADTRPSPTDPTPYLARIAWKSGKITDEELQEIRDMWLEKLSRLTPFEQEELWGLSHVLGIDTREEAEEALAARPRAGAGEPRYDYGFKYFPRMAALGWAYWHAGRIDTALPYLRAVYERCDSLPTIFTVMRSNFVYAQALREAGDLKGACEVYRDIAKHWGKAPKPAMTFKVADKLFGRDCKAAEP